MNKKIFFSFIVLSTSFVAMTSCDDDDENVVSDVITSSVVEDGSTLKGTVSSDVTLGANCTYYLSGELIVESGSTLNIEEGVKIIAQYDDIVDYILVKQGGKINAVGTASNPIVMTSEKEEPGAWGGIHLCGYAATNAEGGTGNSEIGGASYGGSVDDDNSGTLSYVRVEYTGYAFDEEHEANGITFYGVGSGTTVNHCEAYKGSDDGFEFFGGSVNISYMVVVSCSDDSFDWTEGWTGTGSYLVAFQEAESTLGYDCDCLIEADNNENDYEASPTSHPILSNLILVGNSSSDNKRGIRLRRGTEVEITNASVCGKNKAITLESTQTENALLAGTSSLTNIKATSELDSENGIYTNEMFEAAGNTTDSSLSYTSLDDIISECSWMSGQWVK